MSLPSKTMLIRDHLDTLRFYPRSCILCQVEFDENNTVFSTHAPVRLSCDHVFGKKCIVDWLNTADQGRCNSCPLCRQDLFHKESESSRAASTTQASHQIPGRENADPSGSRNVPRVRPRSPDPSSSRHAPRYDNPRPSWSRNTPQGNPGEAHTAASSSRNSTYTIEIGISSTRVPRGQDPPPSSDESERRHESRRERPGSSSQDSWSPWD